MSMYYSILSIVFLKDCVIFKITKLRKLNFIRDLSSNILVSKKMILICLPVENYSHEILKCDIR